MVLHKAIFDTVVLLAYLLHQVFGEVILDSCVNEFIFNISEKRWSQVGIVLLQGYR